MRKIFFLIGVIFLLSGCYDYKELNDMSIVSSIGIDYINDEYEVTLEITDSVKEGSSSEIESNTVSAKDFNISKAFSKAMNMTEKEVYLEHVELLVVGKDLALNGIDDILDYIIRDTMINSNYFMVVSDNAKDILSVKLDNKSISSVIVDTVNYTQGKTNIDDLDILVSQYITDMRDVAVPYVSLVDNNVLYKDVAYFNGDKMVGLIDYKMYSFLVLDSSNISFTSDGNTISVSKKDISFKVDNKTITVDINVYGTVKEIDNDINLKDIKSYGRLEKSLNKVIKEETILFIDTIMDKDSDLLGFKKLYYNKYKSGINDYKYEVKVSSNINKNGTIYEVIHVN